ncbi:hypothetical protein D3C73_1255190 [compost metagenome]
MMPIHSRYTRMNAVPYLKLAISATVRPSSEVHIDTRWSNSTTEVNTPRRLIPRPRAREFCRRLLPYQRNISLRLALMKLFSGGCSTVLIAASGT